jgi:asparagine synthase (glutamine-hydrolysing)
MCGIAGYVSSGHPAPDAALLERMCDRIAHRGPDAYGRFVDEHAALGHRRLSIIDVSGGDQPLGNEDGSLQIIFNGEIYNYLDLRADLIRNGHQFQTRSDTEVIVHLYEEAGERTPEYLNGMFAFAIWDKRKRELFLARDRFGKKPLYYSTSIPGARVAFASELKALTAMPGFDSEVDPVAVADFLSLSYVPDPATIYKSVRKLPPGHSMTVRPQGVAIRKYWELRFEPDPSRRLADAVEEVRALAADSVERRMMSDVPLGAFLSGGVDSSAVVAYMAKAAPGRVKTFSIGFTDKKFDELEYARMVAGRYQSEHREQVVTPDVHEMLDVLAQHFDEPFGDSSAIPTLYLSRMTRQHVTVALSGDGADEIFAGYRRYYYGALEERLRQRFPQWFRGTVIAAAGRYYPKFDYLPQVFRAKTLLSNLAAEIGDAYFTSMSTFRDEGLDRILSPALRGRLGGYSARASYRSRFARHRELPPLEQMQAVDIESWLPGDILVKADRATMAYSLESRSPWLDYRIAELAARFPAAFKIAGRDRKHILKQAVRPLIPAETIDRPKMGFSVPLAEWFRSSLTEIFESRVLARSMEEYIAPDEARRLFREHQAGLANHDRKLWNLLILASWNSTHRESPAGMPGQVLAGVGL